MLDHCTYDKVKLLHEFSCLLWFIENHAKVNAKAENQEEHLAMLEKLSKDIDEHITELEKIVHEGC